MMTPRDRFLAEHRRLTRRYFLGLGAAGAAAMQLGQGASKAAEPAPELAQTLQQLEQYLTPQDQFRDVSRGKPIPHQLPISKQREVGMTRETWKLQVVADPEHPSDLGNPLTQERGTALDWAGLMQLAETRAVSFPKIMTCLNMGRPLGMGIWEGVPLRDVIWMAQPRRDVRRIFYYGYHNDDPDQIFRSSLPAGRVLEEPFGLPPVILCYKLNGQFLTSQRGGPVRLVSPETYGFKSVKWLTHVVCTNLFHANDTYASGNNDVDSGLKTFAATLSVPSQVSPGQPIPVTGYAQVGISGLSRVQVCMHPQTEAWPDDDPYFTRAAWNDASILPPPATWGGGLPGNRIPSSALGFDPAAGTPRHWPLRLAKAHWAALVPGLPQGQYILRCRTIDENGNAQPMPRPFAKSGRTAIEEVPISVKA